MKLFRPVGIKELEKILLLNAKAFPPRLAWQPIFYPVLNEQYAVQIAYEWNTPDEFSGFCGFVVSFDVNDVFIKKYAVQNVGDIIHNELWIPSEELAEMNENIENHILLTKVFYGEKYTGIIENTKDFIGLNATEQIFKIKNNYKNDQDLKIILQNESVLVQINFSFWRNNLQEIEITDKILALWHEISSYSLLM